MNYFDWSLLATYAGTLTMVGVITELTKNLKLIKKIPTQIWSYIIALAIMYPAYYFTGELTLSTVFLIPFNACLLSLSSNGGFEFLKKSLDLLKGEDNEKR